MARIRTIKPEFWTDEKVVQLPFEVRLLFIGLWNFADDEGYLPDQPERIRLQVLPADDVDIEGSLDLLVAAELLVRLELKDGGSALMISNFLEHQRVSHPAKSLIAPEVSRRLQITPEDRRSLGRRFGCSPGGEKQVECCSCGLPGRIWWPNSSKGRPGYWVCFSAIEVVVDEGGISEAKLCCRHCKNNVHQANGIVMKSNESATQQVEDLKPKTVVRRVAKAKPVEAIVIPASLRTKEFLEVWETWKLHRKEIRKPMTPRAEVMALRECEAMGVQMAIAGINRGIASGHQSINPPSNARASAGASASATARRGQMFDPDSPMGDGD